MQVFHPIPSELRNMMTDPKVKLAALSRYLNPGDDGAIFHNYAMKFIRRLHEVGITSFVDLKNEHEKVLSKSSNLSSSMRTHVLGQYKFYVDQYEESLKYWESLTDEQKDKVEGGYIIEEIEDKMKLNLIKINSEVRNNGSSVVSKDAIEADMQIIYDHYKNGSNELPDDLKSQMDNFDPIEFGRLYLSKLIGLDLKFELQGSNVRITN